MDLNDHDRLVLQHRSLRGGRRQRQEALAELHTSDASGASLQAEPEHDSQLGLYLIQEWAWGHKSATEVQKLSYMAFLDQQAALKRAQGNSCIPLSGHISKTLDRLAGLGARGRTPGNCHRDLVRMLGEPKLPCPFEVLVPVKIPKPKHLQPSVANVKMPFLLPHEYFAFLYREHPALFRSLMLGDNGSGPRVEEFWRGVVKRKDPRISRHPMCSKQGWLAHAVPLSLHGDAVPCIQVGKHATKSFDAISMQGLLSEGTTLWVKQLIFGIFEHVKTDTTMEEVWAVIVWSFEVLFAGVWPEKDHRGVKYTLGSGEAALAGSRLCGPYFAVIFQLKGDLDYFAKNLFLRHFNAVEPCDFCPCSTHLSHQWWPNYFEDDAQWKTRLFTVDQWQGLPRNRLHWLFNLPYLTFHNIEPDELHILHLGVSMYMLGSVLWCLVHRRMPDSAVQNMQNLWGQVSAYYSEHQTSTQFSSLNLSSFHNPEKPTKDYPRLKGKGAEIKGLIPAIFEVWNRHMRVGDPYDEQVKACLHRMVAIQNIVDENASELFLPEEDSLNLMRHADVFLKAYSRLGKAADEAGDLLWSSVPKLHWMWHWALRARFLSPRRGSCYIDEDFVGKIKAIVTSVRHGSTSHAISLNVAAKFRLGKDFMLQYY